MGLHRPASAIALPLAWLAATLLIGLADWASGYAGATEQSGDIDVYYVQQHFALTIPLAVVFAVFSAIYFAIGRRLGARFPWHLAWGQLLLSFAGVMLLEAPAIALSRIGLPKRAEDIPTAFLFWNNVSSAGYLAILAGLLLFVYLMLAGLRTRKSART